MHSQLPLLYWLFQQQPRRMGVRDVLPCLLKSLRLICLFGGIPKIYNNISAVFETEVRAWAFEK